MWVPSTCNLTKDIFFFFAPPLRSCKQQLLFSHNSVGQDFRQSCFGWFHKALVGGTQKVTISWWLGLKHLRWLYYMSGTLEWMKNWDRFLFLSFCLSVSISLSPCVFVCLLFVFIFLCGQLRLFYMSINPIYPADLTVYEVSMAKENMVLRSRHAHCGWITVQKFEILEKSYILHILIFLWETASSFVLRPSRNSTLGPKKL